MISPELMGYVKIPYVWKEFHRWCSYDMKSIFDKGLIAGGREKKGRRQTIFFTPLNPFVENSDEEAPAKCRTVPSTVNYRSF